MKSYILLVSEAFPHSFVDKRVLHALLNAVQMGHKIASLKICQSVLSPWRRVFLMPIVY